VTSGPLPPHERQWRHPSELAAPPLEPATRSGRALIVSTATVSLLLVGILALTLTPDRAADPQAMLDSTVETVLTRSAGDLPTTSAIVATTSVGAAAGNPVAPSAPTTVATATVPTATVPAAPITSPATSETGSRQPDAPDAGSPAGPAVGASPTWDDSVVVTPVGNGLGVTTAAAMSAAANADQGTTSLRAALPSGSPVDVDVLDATGDVVVVAFAAGEPPEVRTLSATTAAGTPTFVVIDGTTARFDTAAYPPPDVPEGAPVVDAEGKLVGMSTHSDTGLALVVITSIPTVAAPPTVEPVAASEPTLSTPPATTAVVMPTTPPDVATSTVPEPTETTELANPVDTTATTLDKTA